MKKLFKTLLLLISSVAFVALCIAGYCACKYYQLPLLPNYTDYESLEERATEAQRIAQRRGLSQRYCLLLDYSIPSGTPRLFVWDFGQGKVIASTYVMHGSGGGSTDEKPVFSNRPGSHCSALGRFAVTHQHGYRNSTGYFLRGLDIANRNAYSRGLMIHRARWVDINCWRTYIPLNTRCCMGCVTISSRGMAFISQIMKSENKEVLLWSWE